ncbi:hypothetical protein [Rothia sp. ZJ932]|uniref:hypothetical protein n=1 Tax=Rothia sp. ZJ932 TaxID=2810516 RepID=UPI001967BECD|nr:hypothetical protein [Rothia sp. ZJ932]QRZ62318.1 hypothetical protein JR346_04250 [Rothia sp. ZJ932]
MSVTMVTSSFIVRSLTVLGLLVVAGCSSAPENLNDLEPVDKVNEKNLEQLTSWIFPPEEAEKARAAFIERCVAANGGGTYTIADAQQNTLEGILGTGFTVKEADKHGYELANAGARDGLANSDTAGRSAYFGNSKLGTVETSLLGYSSGKIAANSCLAQSFQYIYGSVEDGLKAAELAPSFGRAVRDEVLDDEKYKDLQNRWATCMSEKGFSDISDTAQAPAHANSHLPKEQKKIAIADATCRHNVDFDAQVSDISQRYFASIYERVKNVGDELEKIHDQAAKNVEADKTDPKDSSPIELQPTPTASAS